MIDQRGLKMYEKREKLSFWTYNICFKAESSLAELGGSPLLPLTENYSA